MCEPQDSEAAPKARLEAWEPHQGPALEEAICTSGPADRSPGFESRALVSLGGTIPLFQVRFRTSKTEVCFDVTGVHCEG